MNVDFANRGNYKKKKAKPICGGVYFTFLSIPQHYSIQIIFKLNPIQPGRRRHLATTWTANRDSPY